jgi:hypothetical protein
VSAAETVNEGLWKMPDSTKPTDSMAANTFPAKNVLQLITFFMSLI